MSGHARSLTRVIYGKQDTRRDKALDFAVAEVAQAQYGLVTRGQLLDLGASEDQIDWRLRRGSLHRVHRGVYAVGHSLLSRPGRWLAAVLALGKGAVLSRRSAGELLEILTPSSRAPEVSSPTRRRREGILVRRTVVQEDEIQIVAGIRTTGLSRTILDLAADSSRSQLEQMINEAEIRGLTDRTSIPMLLERYPRRAGSALLRQMFREQTRASGITRRELERRFKEILEATDLPRPRYNAHVAVGGQFFEADCLWAEQRLIVELDGRAVHGTDRAFERDRRRDRLLVADGWRVTRVTWLQLRDEAPAVVADLRRSLERTSA